jgi:hypothetical protein
MPITDDTTDEAQKEALKEKKRRELKEQDKPLKSM